jgi:hypothetical protein
VELMRQSCSRFAAVKNIIFLIVNNVSMPPELAIRPRHGNLDHSARVGAIWWGADVGYSIV